MRFDENKRRDMRIKTRFETLCSSGVGVLTDISYSGAMLEKSEVQPELGSDVRLFVFLQPVDPIELVGQVVRHTPEGFAIEFKDLDPDVRRFVDDAAAIVTAPKQLD
ncbi:MAG: PilZ domain-containing protein [Myxococcales bacterium]|nr:PilZ domain-containing protein [Myxococcales bacterium]